MIDETIFKKIFNEVIDRRDKIVVIYSGIWSFIGNLNFNVKDRSQIPLRLLETIETEIGTDRTLVLPSFSGNHYIINKSFDIKKSIDRENGYLSTLALKRNYFRTKQPIHSYLAYGNVSEIKKLNLVSSWGKNSMLEFFSRTNARICTLGLPWNEGCSYLHRFEELFKVPWRYNKKISAKFLINKKKRGNCHEIKFCSSSKTKLKYDYKPFVKYIEKAKSFRKSNNNLVKFETIKASCLNKIGKKLFKKNPWVIIKNIKETKRWINYHKDSEIIDLQNKI